MTLFAQRTVAPSIALLLSLAVVGPVQASEEAVKKGMESFIGAPAVESVKRTTYAGLYEVVLKNGQLVYTDEKATFIIDGSIIDTETRRDVTQARMNELSAIDFASLPLDRAIKQVKGKGTRVIATFEDPNCGYCKRLAKDLAGMDDVTIYTFLYPILSPDSTSKSNNIWCAKDRAKAWTGWVLEGKAPADADCDANAVAQNVQLGQQLRISGTPTIFLADGTRIGGYMPAAELEKALDGVKAK
ncbi:DsbC family protein [Thauera linaloolentis]|uniref:Thiol:disulfide interchange protein n=1 Tax=Thauera linaloolentis (strain DSM 12138 / JCM 21573 / CCUG 41526 / CIP 105981 / IAM 15112 / NBRC 102519 / 47Lol) TaxID=1123367 RepID=N6XXP7_THAL4|nr:DsbC family protein [Thauera linaloolentis]ENO86591.1 protein disulfide-isomerase [Thauera linaloolentis 47Lol = DSM 12138]MCM8565777.1 DsbC family protein [Thauera linaloolentis]